LKLGKFGAFIGCSNYPECKHTRPLVVQTEEAVEDAQNSVSVDNGPKILGTDPGTGRTISLRKGPYGPYVQIDEPPESKDKPKRQGIPRGIRVDDVDLEAALKLLALPRLVGMHPETNEKIEAGIGRFGPYLKHQSKYKSIPSDDDVLTIGLNRAVDLLAQAPSGKGRRFPAKKSKEKPAMKAKTKSAPKKTKSKKEAS
jgi:DNA topoisomerase-1